jgi:hypothetical protein
VDRIGHNVRDFMAEVDKNPALLKEATEKLAGWQSYVKKLPEEATFMQRAGAHAKDLAPFALATSGLGLAMGYGHDAARSAVKGMSDVYSKHQAYKTMLEENPALVNADPNVVQKAFNTIYKFNPHYAKDPLVAGTFVKNVIDQDRMDIGTVSNLVQAHKFMNEAKSGKGGIGPDFFRQSIPQVGTADKLQREDAEHGWKGEEHGQKGEEHERRGEKHEWERNREGREYERHEMDMLNHPLNQP